MFNVNDYPTLSEAVRLPLIIKEKDIDYQLYRIVMFDKLLQVQSARNHIKDQLFNF